MIDIIQSCFVQLVNILLKYNQYNQYNQYIKSI